MGHGGEVGVVLDRTDYCRALATAAGRWSLPFFYKASLFPF